MSALAGCMTFSIGLFIGLQLMKKKQPLYRMEISNTLTAPVGSFPAAHQSVALAVWSFRVLPITRIVALGSTLCQA